MSGYFRGRLNTAAARDRPRERSKIRMGDYFCCCSERLDTTAAEPPELVREQPEFVRAEGEPDTRRP